MKDSFKLKESVRSSLLACGTSEASDNGKQSRVQLEQSPRQRPGEWLPDGFWNVLYHHLASEKEKAAHCQHRGDSKWRKCAANLDLGRCGRNTLKTSLNSPTHLQARKQDLVTRVRVFLIPASEVAKVVKNFLVEGSQNWMFTAMDNVGLVTRLCNKPATFCGH